MSETTSEWYLRTRLGDECCSNTHCAQCKSNGDCDSCGTIDGRFMEAVNEYASTCDQCGEPTHHHHLTMEPLTQLGYCDDCIPKLSDDIRGRLDGLSHAVPDQ